MGGVVCFTHVSAVCHVCVPQDAFKVPLVIQLTDDEKFLWR